MSPSFMSLLHMYAVGSYLGIPTPYAYLRISYLKIAVTTPGAHQLCRYIIYLNQSYYNNSTRASVISIPIRY